MLAHMTSRGPASLSVQSGAVQTGVGQAGRRGETSGEWSDESGNYLINQCANPVRPLLLSSKKTLPQSFWDAAAKVPLQKL